MLPRATFSFTLDDPGARDIHGGARFRGDGRPDVVWQNVAAGDRSSGLMDGASCNGLYVLLPTVPTEWSIVGAADFNSMSTETPKPGGFAPPGVNSAP